MEVGGANKGGDSYNGGGSVQFREGGRCGAGGELDDWWNPELTSTIFFFNGNNRGESGRGRNGVDCGGSAARGDGKVGAGGEAGHCDEVP